MASAGVALGGARARLRLGASVRASAATSSKNSRGAPPSPRSTRPPIRRSTQERHELEPESCYTAIVTASNEADDDATKIDLSVNDFPGLLRVVSWVLNGMQLQVQKARLFTEDGVASQEFFVTDLDGNKVANPDLLTSRLQQFVQFCSPDQDAMEARQIFNEGQVTIDNEENENYSVITFDSADRDEPGLLLTIASTITALGITIHEAIICKDCSAEHITKANADGRVFKFYVHTVTGEKLNYVDASSALFTLNLVLQECSNMSGMPIHASDLNW